MGQPYNTVISLIVHIPAQDEQNKTTASQTLLEYMLGTGSLSKNSTSRLVVDYIQQQAVHCNIPRGTDAIQKQELLINKQSSSNLGMEEERRIDGWQEN